MNARVQNILEHMLEDAEDVVTNSLPDLMQFLQKQLG